MIVGAILLTLYIMLATVTLGQREPSVEVSPVTILGTIGDCPSDNIRQASFSFLQNAVRETINKNVTEPISEMNVCGPGEWRRVFYLNASSPVQSCPGQWRLLTSPLRGCAGADRSCRSAFSDNINTTYSKVCGRIIGEGTVSLDAFRRFIFGQNTIEGNYLDGVSVTHGVSGSRTHIWTFGAGHGTAHGPPRCPCDNSDRSIAPLPPAEVGDNWFCDRADEVDHIWTGENCMTNNPCCSFHNPPYFSVQLPSATTDRIELRICIDQSHGDETVLVLFAEIYVQ